MERKPPENPELDMLEESDLIEDDIYINLTV